MADVLDTGSVEIELGEQIQTIVQLLGKLSQKGPDWQKNLGAEKVQITVNRQFADGQSKINNSDEIALIPLPGTI